MPGTAVFMFKDLGKAPPALVNNLRHNKVLHKTDADRLGRDSGHAARADGRTSHRHARGARRVPGAARVRFHGGTRRAGGTRHDRAPRLVFDPDDVTYFIGHESIIAGKAPGMNPLAEHLFVWLNRGADSASRFFSLPYERVFEVGSHVEI